LSRIEDGFILLLYPKSRLEREASWLLAMRIRRQFLRHFIAFLKQQKQKVLTLVLTLVICVSTATIVSALFARYISVNLPSMGVVYMRGIEAYWDQNLTNKTGNIQWGTTYPGGSYSSTIYLRSVSNVETLWQLTSENWTYFDSSDKIAPQPYTSSQPMILAWNYDNAIIRPNEIRAVVLTLFVSGSTDFIEYLIRYNIRRFSFDILIQAL